MTAPPGQYFKNKKMMFVFFFVHSFFILFILYIHVNKETLCRAAKFSPAIRRKNRARGVYTQNHFDFPPTSDPEPSSG
jgi:hypothetical protein